jgi:hypothetical protein
MRRAAEADGMAAETTAIGIATADAIETATGVIATATATTATTAITTTIITAAITITIEVNRVIA